MDNNKEQLKKLARVFNADKIVTPEDIAEVLKGVLNIMNSFKTDNQKLNTETKQVAEALYDKILTEHQKLTSELENLAQSTKEDNSTLKDELYKAKKELKNDLDIAIESLKAMIESVSFDENFQDLDNKISQTDKKIDAVKKDLEGKLPKDFLTEDKIQGRYVSPQDLDRAISILDQRTSFLLQRQTTSTGTGITDGDKGDITVSGSGATWTIDDDTIGLDELSATGTPSASTFLRGDNTWATISASPGGSNTQLQYNNAGSFGGISGATTNGTTVTFTTGNLIGADVKANSSAGLQILSNAGTVTALFGAGGGANSTLYGGTKLDYATASTVPYLDASKNLISSAVTPTELGYLSGVTSSIQTQIGTKVTGPASATDNAVVRFDNTTGKLVQDSAVTIADTSGDITGGKYNKVTITAPATGSTLTIADGQTLTVNGSATITNGTHSGTNTGDQTASTLAIAKLSTPAVDTVQEYLDSTGSSGYFSGGEITNGAAGTVNIAAGAGFIRATNSTTAQLLSFEWSAFSNVAIASDTTKYIYISYNGGSPTYVLSATATDEDPTKILVGIATNEGGTIVATLNAGVRLDESIGEAGRYIRRVFGFVRDSSVGGLIVSGTGTRNIALSAGTLWYGRTMYNISAIDTSGAGTFATYYRNGSGGFTKTSSVTQWNNTQYDNGTGTLATLAANKWAVAWLYVSADGLFYYVYGRASHTSQAAAETEALPATLPNVITAGTLLVGRLIFQKSASTATFYSAFTNTFSNTGVTLHNDLGSIQGGTTGEYYHLTSAEYTGTGTGNFVRATSPTLTTPAIGTPSSGTLTNCTGLPLSGVASSTSTALGVGSLELGHASDTTLARASAGVIAVEGVAVPTISSTDTLSNKTLTAPKIANAGYIADANGNEQLIFTTTASAVNEITLANAATGNNPNITASGGDANVGIDLTPKGTGSVNIKGNSTQSGTLKIFEDTDNGTNSVAIKAPASLTADYTLTLPANDGDANQYLQTDGSGNLTWATVAGGGAWTLKEYSTASNATGITSGTLDLSTDKAYRVILKVGAKGTTSSSTLFAKINGVTTANSYFDVIQGRTYDGTTAGTINGGFKDSQLNVFEDGWNSYYVEMDISLISYDGTNTRPVFTWLANGYYQDATEKVATINGSGFQNTQTNVTSLNFNTNATSKDWTMWILRPNTA